MEFNITISFKDSYGINQQSFDKAVSNSLQKSHVNNVNIPELNLAFV